MNGYYHSARQQELVDLKDWFLDTRSGVSVDLLDKNLALGIAMKTNWRDHTIFLYHAAIKAANVELNRSAINKAASFQARDQAKQVVRKHLRNWAETAMSFTDKPEPWCIPSSLRAFEILKVCPPKAYVELCQNAAIGTLGRLNKRGLLDWFGAGADLTLNFGPEFTKKLCGSACKMAVQLTGHELHILARKMAVMDAVNEARFGDKKTPYIAETYQKIFSHILIDRKVRDASRGEDVHLMPTVRAWFKNDGFMPPDAEGKNSNLQSRIYRQFCDAGALPRRAGKAGDGHGIDLSFSFNRAKFMVEVDGPDHVNWSSRGQVITLNGGSILQTLLTCRVRDNEVLARLPYAVQDRNRDQPRIWRGLCESLSRAAAGAHLVKPDGTLTRDLLALCPLEDKPAPG